MMKNTTNELCAQPAPSLRRLVRSDRGCSSRDSAQRHRDDHGGGAGRNSVAPPLSTAEKRAEIWLTPRPGVRLPARSSYAHADGHVRKNRDRRAARPYQGRGRQDERVEVQIAAGLPAAHETSRSSDRGCLSTDQRRRVRRAFGGFQRRGGQGCGQPHLAQGEGRLGCLERAAVAEEVQPGFVRLILDGTVVRVRLDKKATSISLLVALGVREDGQKVLLAVRIWEAKARQPGERSSTIL